MNIELSAEEVNVLLLSAQHCLNSHQDEGTDARWPDNEQLRTVMAKLQSGVKD